MDNRFDYVDFVEMTPDELKAQFIEKNKQYGGYDPLINFVKGAEIRYGEANYHTLFQTALDYEIKHIAHVVNKGVGGEKVDASLKDIAIYSLIELYLVYKYNDQGGKNEKI